MCVWDTERTFHVSKSETLPSQTVRGTIDINNRFLSQRHPHHLVGIWMVLLDKADDLVDCRFRRLSTGVDIGTWDIPEVNGSLN